MQVILWGFLVALCGQNSSAKTEDAKRQTEQAIQKIDLNKPGCSTCELFAIGRDKITSETACLQKLCPNGYGIIDAKLDTLDSEELDAELSEQSAKWIAQALVADLTSQYERLVSIQSFLKKQKNITEPQALQLSSTFKAIELFEKLEVDMNGNVDEAQTTQNLKNESPQARAVVLALAKKYMEILKAPSTPPIIQGELEHLAQSYSTEEIQMQIIRAHDFVKQKTKTLADQTKLSPEAISGSSTLYGEIAKRLRGGNYSLADFEDLKSSYMTGALFEYALSDPKLKALHSKEPVAIAARLGKNGEAELDRRIKKIKKYLDGSAQKDMLEALRKPLTNCISVLYYARAFLPTSAQKQAFRKVEKSHRIKYVSGLKAKMSHSSGQELAKDVEAWKLGLPLTPQEFTSHFRSSLENFRQEKDEASALSRNFHNTSAQQAALTYQLFNEKNFAKEEKYADSLNEICTELTPLPFPDQALVGTPYFNLGSLTMTDPYMGEGIEFHEYTHMATRFFTSPKVSVKTKEWFEKTRSCLQDVKASKKYLEEDWADLISSSISKTNFLCPTISNSTENFTLINPKLDDPHSSRLYRVLQNYYINYNTIPPECTVALKEKKETFVGKNCLTEGGR